MLKAVYALVGPDVFLQLNKQAELLNKAPVDAQRIETDGEVAELAQVLDELRSFAMFGEHKIVAVRDADPFILRFGDAIEKYLASPVDSATLILRCSGLRRSSRIYRRIEQCGEIHRCVPARELSTWIMNRAKCHGVCLTSGAARFLADLVGPDLCRLDSELPKLAGPAGGKRITPADLSSAIAFHGELGLVELTDALSAGDVAEAARRWRQLIELDAASQRRVFVCIEIWLATIQKGLKMKRAGRGTYDICEEARIRNRDVHEPFIETMTALGEAGANRALAQLAELEYQHKIGTQDMTGNVERFLLSLQLRPG